LRGPYQGACSRSVTTDQPSYVTIPVCEQVHQRRVQKDRPEHMQHLSRYRACVHTLDTDIQVPCTSRVAPTRDNGRSKVPALLAVASRLALQMASHRERASGYNGPA
jgi:hypothetical protein